MCGIFGVFFVKPPQEQRHHEILAPLVEANLERGNKQHGYLAHNPETPLTFARRFTKPFTFDTMTELPMQAVFAHVRAPTGGSGDTNNVSEVHPYEAERLFLMMNGILINYLNPQNELRRLRYSMVDTSYLAGSINWALRDTAVQAAAAAAVKEGKDADHKVIREQLIASAVESFEGQQACIMFDKATRSFYLWRVMSTLYVGFGKDYLVFSSAKVPDVADNLLNEGTIMRLDPGTKGLYGAASFKFTTPYAAAEPASVAE